MIINGLRVVESVHLTEPGEPYQARRSWRVRLFSLPWRPWKATHTVIPQVPMKGGYRQADGSIIMHPETVRLLRETLKK